jgi:hypothetical protein
MVVVGLKEASLHKIEDFVQDEGGNDPNGKNPLVKDQNINNFNYLIFTRVVIY